MISLFGFVMQIIPMDENNGFDNSYNYTIEEIVPGETKEVPISMGPPGKKSYHGILHIYRTQSPKNFSDCRTLVALNIHASVPVKTVVSHLFPYWSVIEHIKVVKGEKMNRYSALIRFKTHVDATLCYQNFDGYTIPDRVNTVLNLSFVHSLQITKSKNFVPPKNSIELPSCPVCLEDLDETVNGLMTIQCDHTFHRECIYKWHDFNCPVCRLEQSPLNTGDQKCKICGSTDSLWICLICGFIGCDRYQNKHAVLHFEETCHTFSKQIGGTKVWDYVSDCYVHRIISNHGDNKLVEWETIAKSPNTFTSDHSLDLKLNHMEKEYMGLIAIQLESQQNIFAEKMNQLSEEHRKEIQKIHDIHRKEMTSFMTNSARTIDAKCKEFNTQLNKYKSTIENFLCDISNKDQQIVQLEQQINGSSVGNVPKKSKTQERRLNSLQKKVKQLQDELIDEKQLSNTIGLAKVECENRLADFLIQADEKEQFYKKQIQSLEEKVRDLSIHLDLSCDIKNNPEKYDQINSTDDTSGTTVKIKPTQGSFNLTRDPFK